MADEKEKRGGFFKILKQFMTGEESGESNPSKEKISIPENEDELEKLLKTKSQGNLNIPEKKRVVVPEEEIITPEPQGSAQEKQMAEVARLLQFVAKMDRPGPQTAYFEFLNARDGAGVVDPGMEKVVMKTIISSLSAVPDLKGISAELIAADAERHLKLLQDFAAKRLLELETASKGASKIRQDEIKGMNSEIQARKKAIETLQAEIVDFEKKVNALEDAEVEAATESVHNLNAARRAAEQVSNKIQKDINEIRKFLIPPPTNS